MMRWRRVVQVLHVGTMIGLFLMMSITVSDVLLRYLARKPIIGGTELVELLMVSFGLGWAYCTVQKVHIRADFLVARLPQIIRQGIEKIWDLLALIVVVLLAWRFLREALWAIRNKEVTAVLNIPMYPAWVLFTICFCFLGMSIGWKLIQGIGNHGGGNDS